MVRAQPSACRLTEAGTVKADLRGGRASATSTLHNVHYRRFREVGARGVRSTVVPVIWPVRLRGVRSQSMAGFSVLLLCCRSDRRGVSRAAVVPLGLRLLPGHPADCGPNGPPRASSGPGNLLVAQRAFA